MSFKFDFDEVAKQLDAVEFTLRGKAYRIESLPPHVIDQVNALRDEVDDSSSVDDLNARTLSLLTGQPEDDFRGLDVRLARIIVDQVLEALFEQAGKRERKKGRGSSRVSGRRSPDSGTGS